jgi:hypothetical protein
MFALPASLLSLLSLVDCMNERQPHQSDEEMRLK